MEMEIEEPGDQVRAPRHDNSGTPHKKLILTRASERILTDTDGQAPIVESENRLVLGSREEYSDTNYSVYWQGQVPVKKCQDGYLVVDAKRNLKAKKELALSMRGYPHCASYVLEGGNNGEISYREILPQGGELSNYLPQPPQMENKDPQQPAINADIHARSVIQLSKQFQLHEFNRWSNEGRVLEVGHDCYVYDQGRKWQGTIWKIIPATNTVPQLYCLHFWNGSVTWDNHEYYRWELELWIPPPEYELKRGLTSVTSFAKLRSVQQFDTVQLHDGRLAVVGFNDEYRYQMDVTFDDGSAYSVCYLSVKGPVSPSDYQQTIRDANKSKRSVSRKRPMSVGINVHHVKRSHREEMETETPEPGPSTSSAGVVVPTTRKRLSFTKPQIDRLVKEAVDAYKLNEVEPPHPLPSADSLLQKLTSQFQTSTENLISSVKEQILNELPKVLDTPKLGERITGVEGKVTTMTGELNNLKATFTKVDIEGLSNTVTQLKNRGDLLTPEVVAKLIRMANSADSAAVDDNVSIPPAQLQPVVVVDEQPQSVVDNGQISPAQAQPVVVDRSSNRQPVVVDRSSKTPQKKIRQVTPFVVTQSNIDARQRTEMAKEPVADYNSSFNIHTATHKHVHFDEHLPDGERRNHEMAQQREKARRQKSSPISQIMIAAATAPSNLTKFSPEFIVSEARKIAKTSKQSISSIARKMAVAAKVDYAEVEKLMTDKERSPKKQAKRVLKGLPQDAAKERILHRVLEKAKADPALCIHLDDNGIVSVRIPWQITSGSICHVTHFKQAPMVSKAKIGSIVARSQTKDYDEVTKYCRLLSEEICMECPLPMHWTAAPTLPSGEAKSLMELYSVQPAPWDYLFKGAITDLQLAAEHKGGLRNAIAVIRSAVTAIQKYQGNYLVKCRKEAEEYLSKG